MSTPTTDAGRQAVKMRGLFGGETEERAAQWVVLIEQQARTSRDTELEALRTAIKEFLPYETVEKSVGDGLFRRVPICDAIVAEYENLRAAISPEDPAP